MKIEKKVQKPFLVVQTFCDKEQDRSKLKFQLSNYYKHEYEDGINVIDKSLKIKWPSKKLLISEKDMKLQSWENFKKQKKYF